MATFSLKKREEIMSYELILDKTVHIPICEPSLEGGRNITHVE